MPNRLQRFALLAALIAAGCSPAPSATPRARVATPRNIIVLVGDGVGTAHWTAARMIGVASRSLQVERMPVTGLMLTTSLDSAETDSAAAATAMFTGTKTNNRMINVDPSDARLWSLMELARAQGKVGGIVTTTRPSDATPAAFGGAHVRDRGDESVIARQLVRAGVELIAGARRDALYELESPEDQGSSAVGIAKEAGYVVVEGGEAFAGVSGARVLALFDQQPEDVDDPAAPLARLVDRAIALLDHRGTGFVLLAEHEGTDSTSHQHNNAGVIASLRSLDEAIGVALDFAERDGHTLVIVAGDHETGGLTLRAGASPDEVELVWSTDKHTTAAVPCFAFGPGAERFGGLHENADFGIRLTRLLAGP